MRKSYFRYGKYKMRASDYQLMLADQGGKCSICSLPPEKGKRLDIDHDHKTGEVRGLLCGSHNRMLGMAKDNPEILLAAAKYLEEGGDCSRFYIEGGRLLSSFEDKDFSDKE